MSVNQIDAKSIAYLPDQIKETLRQFQDKYEEDQDSALEFYTARMTAIQTHTMEMSCELEVLKRLNKELRELLSEALTGREY